MAVAAPSSVPCRSGRGKVAAATALTVAAGLVLPGGALVVGLVFAYIVWGDNPQLRYRFAMLAGVFTVVWALLFGIAASGIFDSVHTSSTSTVVTGP